MYRPSFSVTALTLTALTGLGFVAVSQRYRLPLPPTNRLGGSSSAYLQQGSRQAVDWRKYDDEAFLQARRRGQPILLVIGNPWSAISRTVDKNFFEDPDIAGFLNRTFVCVRLDGNESPEWAGCLYPVSRGPLGVLPEFQMWVVSPQGRTIQLLARDDKVLRFNPDNLRSSLKKAFNQFAGDESSKQAGAVQADDRRFVRDSAPAFSVPFSNFAEAVRKVQTENGGQIPRSGLAMLNPSIWEFQYATGQGALVDVALDRLMFSPMFDAVDGGFYHSAPASNIARCTFDKVATENAAMAMLLAQRSVANQSPIDAELARMTFDFMDDKLGMEVGIASAQIGDEQRDHRSLRQSFPPLRLGELPRDQQAAAIDRLGLRRDVNPLMLPFFPDGDAVFSVSTNPVQAAIRKYRKGKPIVLVENRIASVEGYVVARMIDTARILGDSERLSRAQKRASDLSDFFLDGEILKVISDDKMPPRCLVSYLGLADAYLSSFLATGQVTDLQTGERILRLAMKQFSTGRAGIYRITGLPTDQKFTIENTDVPDIVDGNVEAATARLLRLSYRYGQVLGDAGLIDTAKDIQAKFAGFAGDLGPQTASFFVAAAALKDRAFFVTVGNQAPSLAMSLASRSPFRLVIPAVGPVRRDLQTKPAGVYIVIGDKTEGPFSVSDAAAKLSPTYDLGI